MTDTGSDTLSEPNDNETKQDPGETLASPWKIFILKKSTENGFHFLKTSKKSIFGDISIRVENDEFLLDRVILTTKSNYFDEATFPRELSRKCWESMIQRDLSYYGITSERFSLIVDIMYGKDLKSAMDEHNFVSLLKDMDYLKMEIDLEIFRQFVDEKIKSKSRFNEHMFELYDFLLTNEDHKYDYFLPTVTEYISDRLWKACEEKEFLSVSVAGLVRILRNYYNRTQAEENDSIARICAEWICQDFESRIVHLKDLVNATKFRYGYIRYCVLDNDSIVLTLNRSSQENRVENVEKCFNKLLYYDGEFTFKSSLKDESNIKFSDHPVNSIDPETKWKQTLDKKWFCDVTISTQGHLFNLHRIKLSSESQYFYDLFTDPKELLSSDDTDDLSKPKPKQYSLDDMNPEIFKTIISYIHYEEILVTSETLLIRLLKASKVLEISDLFDKCYSTILTIVPTLLPGTQIELFDFVSEKMKHTTLYRKMIKRLIHVNTQPKLCDNPVFKFFPLIIVQEILASSELTIDDPEDILNLCSDWICHDIENRHRHTLELANFINRNFMMNMSDNSSYVKLEMPPTSKNPSESSTLEFVKNQLIGILASNILVPSYREFTWKIKPQPRFIILKEGGVLSITDVHFNEIVPIQLKIPRLQCNESGVKISQPRGTLIEDKLFIIFNIEKIFYFQVYDFFSGKLISLATDSRMVTTQRYFLLNCKDDIFFCVGRIILKYSFLVNRWVTVSSNNQKGAAQRYTSDGKRLYRIFVEKAKNLHDKTLVRADFLDMDLQSWNTLPDVPVSLNLNVQTRTEPHPNGTPNTKTCWIDPPPIKVDIINNELNVLSSSRTFSFNWTSQTWNSIQNFHTDFCEFTGHEQKILYVSLKRVVYSLSPAAQSKWTLAKKFPEAKDIVAIHTVHKYSYTSTK